MLPIDAHPDPFYGLDGQPWRGRVQTYDAPFSLKRADSFTLHINGTRQLHPGRRRRSRCSTTPAATGAPSCRGVGVKTPGVGVTLKVTKQKGTSMTVKLGTSTKVSPTATLTSARKAARD